MLNNSKNRLMWFIPQVGVDYTCHNITTISVFGRFDIEERTP